MKNLAPKRMPAWYKLAVAKPGRQKAFCTCTAETLEHGALWSLASAYQNYMDPAVQLGAPRQPILAIWGLADGSHPPENAERVRRLAPDVNYVALPGVGHFAELEAPKKVFDLVRAFVAEPSPGASLE